MQAARSSGSKIAAESVFSPRQSGPVQGGVAVRTQAAQETVFLFSP